MRELLDAAKADNAVAWALVIKGNVVLIKTQEESRAEGRKEGRKEGAAAADAG